MKCNVKRWLKDYHNVLLVGIILFALILRLYYFSKTLSQPLWWDEAEYMSMARAWAYGLEYTFIPVRPVLLSLITAFFFKISSTEFLARFFMLILSLATIPGMYCLGKEFYNEKVGLISSFLVSVFWLGLFFSFRLLVDLPSLTFFIFSTLFFYRYIKYDSKKALYIGSVIIALGVLFRLSTGIFLICFLFYLLFTQKLRFIKKKEFWISGLIFILILSPYLIWGYMQFDGFVIKQAMDWNAPKDNSIGNVWWNASSYFRLFPIYLSWPLLLVFIIGLLLYYKVLVGVDVIIKGKGGELNKELFLILLFLLPIIFTSMSFYHHIENRYIITAFPAVFIIAANVLIKFYDSMKKQKILAAILIIVFLGYVAHFQMTTTNNSINSKIDSYGMVRFAGQWIDQNMDKSVVIVTKSWPQMTYYSNRKILSIPDDKNEFLQQLDGVDNVYLFLSSFEPHEQWTIQYPQEANLSIVQIFFLDAQKTKPGAIIYNMSETHLSGTYNMSSPSQSSL